MSKPRFFFDNSCTLCRSWVARWRRQTGDRVRYVAFEHPQEERSVEYCDEAGVVSRGAEAVARLLANVPGQSWMLFLYERIKPIAWLGELAYRIVASCRSCGVRARPMALVLLIIVCVMIGLLLIISYTK